MRVLIRCTDRTRCQSKTSYSVFRFFITCCSFGTCVFRGCLGPGVSRAGFSTLTVLSRAASNVYFHHQLIILSMKCQKCVFNFPQPKGIYQMQGSSLMFFLHMPGGASGFKIYLPKVNFFLPQYRLFYLLAVIKTV